MIKLFFLNTKGQYSSVTEEIMKVVVARKIS